MKLNKNKINNCISTLLLLLTLLIFSCEEFLREEPTGSITIQTELTSLQQGQALTNGAYRMLTTWHNGAEDWGNYLPNTIEYWTGKFYTGLGHPQYWRWQSDQVNGDLLSDFNYFWNNHYDGVRDCNTAIALIPTISGMTEAQRNLALGEVRTLRAFYYFMLVRYFGDVPMITENPSDPDFFQQPRISLKTIYDEVIIPDLEFAINESGLLAGRSTGRVTLDVARAIAADVYLTCAGYPYQEVATNPERNWCVEGSWAMSEYPVNSQSAIAFLQKSKAELDALYGKYTLGTYDDLRNPNMDFQGEAIFQISYIAGIKTIDGVLQSYFPNNSGVTAFNEERGTQIPTEEYYNSYSDDDLRKAELYDENVPLKRSNRAGFFFSYDFKSNRYDPSNSRVDFAHPHLAKFYDPILKTSSESDLNWSHYRYAEILLMLTEVNWMLRELGQSVSDTDIVKGINAVRERAELPPLVASNIDLLDILSERAYELIGEQKMIWDQRRTRHVTADGDQKFTLQKFVGHTPPRYTYSWSAKHLLSPIGNVEIQVNGNAQQNFGYLPRQTTQ